MDRGRERGAPLIDDYLAVRTAAVKLAAGMLATLNAPAKDDCDYAVKSGGKLFLQIGPLPQCLDAEIVLHEPEGGRMSVAKLNAQK